MCEVDLSQVGENWSDVTWPAPDIIVAQREEATGISFLTNSINWILIFRWSHQCSRRWGGIQTGWKNEDVARRIPAIEDGTQWEGIQTGWEN